MTGTKSPLSRDQNQEEQNKLNQEKIKEVSSENSEKEKSLLLEIPTQAPKDFATNMSDFDKNKQYFHVMDHLEPHNVRRIKILKAHPEVEKLFEKDPISFYYVIVINIAQIGMMFFLKNYVESWMYVFILAYLVSAVLNHALFCLMHDITHFTTFKSVFHNQLCGILSNLPQGIPNAISFGRYHRDHHTFLGDAVDDPDIPTRWEVNFFSNKYLKACFLMVLPFFYGLRPYFKRPKLQNKMEVLNIVCCVIYNYLVCKYFGFQSLAYLLLGTLWGLSINPVGAHVLAEHYEFNKCQDTYSYYGWINYLNCNMGYHVEHHDFPLISWNKLPELRKIAPEFYNNLPVIDSYFHVMYSYIFDDEIGPWSRIVRENNEIKDEKDYS